MGYNSSEVPYKKQNETDNLASPDDEHDVAVVSARHERRTATEGALITDLEEDAPELHQEHIGFVPEKPKEVHFDLPDVLPDLGPVADLKWRQDEQSVAETDRFGGAHHVAAVPRRQSNYPGDGGRRRTSAT